MNYNTFSLKITQIFFFFNGVNQFKTDFHLGSMAPAAKKVQILLIYNKLNSLATSTAQKKNDFE